MGVDGLLCGFIAACVLVWLPLVEFQYFGFVVVLADFSVLPRPECQLAGFTSQRTSVLTTGATARQVQLSRVLSRLSTGLWRVSSSGTCRFSCSSETGVPAGWTRVSEDLGYGVLERRRGRINSRGYCRGFLLDF